jgi:hypothetical protein
LSVFSVSRDARRELIKLSVYVAQICNSMGDFARARDVIFSDLRLLRKAWEKIAGAFLISANLHIAFLKKANKCGP